MKIVHVVESLAVGGLERVVLNLASWQCRHGHASRVVCLFHDGALADEARALGLDVVAIGKDAGFDVRALCRLRMLLRDSGADVLHTHNPMAHYYAVGAALGLGIGRVINTRHGMGPSQHASRLDRLYRMAMLRTDVAVSVCHEGRSRFVDRGVIPAAKARVIPNGIALSGIDRRSSTARESLLASLGRPSSSVVLGTVGRVSPVKDHATLLEAVRLLHLAGRQVQLLVVGDGESRASLEALARTLTIEECVHFLGMRHDVGRLLGAMDIFALSSISEGYSLALVEAAAASLPIVATRVGGNADIVIDGVSGLLVPAKDPRSMADALLRLVDDHPLREKMGSVGREWALQNGTIDAMGQAYLGVYRCPSPAATANPGAQDSATTPGQGA